MTLQYRQACEVEGKKKQRARLHSGTGVGICQIKYRGGKSVQLEGGTVVRNKRNKTRDCGRPSGKRTW